MDKTNLSILKQSHCAAISKKMSFRFNDLFIYNILYKV